LSVGAWDIAAPNKAMVEMLNAKGIPVLDLFPPFVAHTANGNEPLYFAKDYHFTPEGHRVAAELVCDWVIDNQLIGP
jgi:lysophospholipase L1-like esterase